MTSDVDASLPLAGLRIGHLGRQPGYTRDRIVAKALVRAGADVVPLGSAARFPARWWASARAMRRERFDVVLVSTLSQTDVPVDRLVGMLTGTPVVFDASIALHESMVESRRTTRAGSVHARMLATQDFLACTLASRILIDTNTHLAYLSERSRAPASRFARIWLGADDDVMRPRERDRRGPFRVLFYATYSPLHGAEQIVRAAAQISSSDDEIEFLMVGSGYTDAAIRALADDLGVTSIRFSGRVPYLELPDLIATSDVCLGVFGTIPPTSRVIPFKVFDALAMARPVITADTPAAREVLVDGVHCRLCPPGDPAAIADAVLGLKNDARVADALAERGYELFRDRFSIDALSRDLADVLISVVTA